MKKYEYIKDYSKSSQKKIMAMNGCFDFESFHELEKRDSFFPFRAARELEQIIKLPDFLGLSTQGERVIIDSYMVISDWLDFHSGDLIIVHNNQMINETYISLCNKTEIKKYNKDPYKFIWDFDVSDWFSDYELYYDDWDYAKEDIWF